MTPSGMAYARLDELIETFSDAGLPQRNVLVNLNELKMIRDLLVEPNSGTVEVDSSGGHNLEEPDQTCSTCGDPVVSVAAVLDGSATYKDTQGGHNDRHTLDAEADPNWSNVVVFPGRFDSQSMTCRCGSEWFNLAASNDRPPAVCLNAEGVITGYHGRLECRECGQVIA